MQIALFKILIHYNVCHIVQAQAQAQAHEFETCDSDGKVMDFEASTLHFKVVLTTTISNLFLLKACDHEFDPNSLGD